MDETAADQPNAETAEVVEQPKPEVDWKAKSREWERRAKENAVAAARLAELEESQKSEAQRLADALDAERRRALDAEQSLLRYRIATSKNLRPELVDRLRGDTEEEIAEDAERLLALTAPPQSATTPSFDGGPRGTTPAPADWNSAFRRVAGKAT